MNFDNVDNWFIPEDPTHSVLIVRDPVMTTETYTDDDVTETVTVQRAIWRKKIHVHYDKNNPDAEGNTPDSFFRYGLDWKASPCGFTSEDDAFNRWNSKPDGTGTDFNIDIENNDGNVNRDLTAYAIWGDGGNDSITTGDQITLYEKNGKVINDSWTAPETSKYRIYAASGGGGGAAWWRTHDHAHKEYNGGRGDWYYCDIDLNAGDVVTIESIGGGGAGANHQGGNGGSNGSAQGGNGGATRWYVKNLDGSHRYEVWLSGGGGGRAGHDSHNGSAGGIEARIGVTLVSARQPRWVLPMDFCLDYSKEFVEYITESLNDDNKKLPKDNWGNYTTYGTKFNAFWRDVVSTFEKYMRWQSAAGRNPPLDPDRYANVIKYMNWSKYSDVRATYIESASFISLMSISAKVLNSSGEKLWEKNSDKEYSNALLCAADSETQLRMITRSNSQTDTSGTGGAAYKKDARSGQPGCMKITFAPGYPLPEPEPEPTPEPTPTT